MKTKSNIITLLVLAFISFSCEFSVSQTAKSYRELLKSTQNEKFPKTLVYDGPQLPISYKDYINLGFDYISSYSLENPKSVPNKYKYVLWTGIASNDANAKWEKEKSPYVDDISQYANRWENRLKFYKNEYANPSDYNKFGMMVLDIESKKTNEELNKNPPYRSKTFRNKSKAIENYKKDMLKLYEMPLELAKEKHNNYLTWSSYDDLPIERTWWSIPAHSWSKWTTDPTVLNYITHKTIKGKTYETDFSKSLDFYSIGIYYFYSPKHTDKSTANQYLAYLIFHIEANQAWTSKPIYVYHYFKFQGSDEFGSLIDANMVRNSVIFSFISGADGMILYDDIRKANNDPKYHALIKTFVNTVSQLNKYNEYFKDENVVFFRPTNPRDLFVDRKVVIRGIEKNGKLLLAATNPFADDLEITRTSINYKDKEIRISLTGKETLLKEIVL